MKIMSKTGKIIRKRVDGFMSDVEKTEGFSVLTDEDKSLLKLRVKNLVDITFTDFLQLIRDMDDDELPDEIRRILDNMPKVKQ